MQASARHHSPIWAAIALSLSLFACAAMAQEASDQPTAEESAPVSGDSSVMGSDKLLLTGGVSQIEGAAGGGLTPWAIIGGNGTRDQIGANVFFTRIDLNDYHLDDAGFLIGLYDRIELSFAQQHFDTEDVGAALGLNRGFTLRQDIFGAKFKVAGDAVLEQDSWLPQIAVGLQYKHNDQGDVLRTIGVKDDSGTDFYVSATKLYLAESLLVDATLRFTKANQTGLLGFGGDKNNSYKPEFEGSLAYLLRRDFAIGAEYRSKPNNLGIAKEDAWFDIFMAWAPTKNVSVTLAYVDLGNIVIRDNQHGIYLSMQLGF